ncbi:MAG: hypothetical protein K2J42_10375 [Muribaculaceae bacterium]|nr:hypothetical protein [Muribaculaceae bacterium]MDE6810473.1 hypothetical protein [Muribaculaceae bacterium]
MKTLSIEELQVLFGGEDNVRDKCDDLQREANEHEELDGDSDEGGWWDRWIDRFLEECAGVKP